MQFTRELIEAATDLGGVVDQLDDGVIDGVAGRKADALDGIGGRDLVAVWAVEAKSRSLRASSRSTVPAA